MVAPFHRVAVITEADPPVGVVTANTIEFKFTPSPLGLVTWNCRTGTPIAPVSCVESGGVPATVATVKTGGVEVGVVVRVWVWVIVKVLVNVGEGVKVGVFVGEGVKVGEGVAVARGN